MKYLILILACLIAGDVRISAQDTLIKKEKSFSWNLQARAESLPYAPFPAQTIGPKPVIIGILNAKWKHVVNLSYWESFDPFGNEGGGDYHGLFTTLNPFGKKNKTFFLKNAHFFDFRFNGNYTSVLGVQVKVWKFSFLPLQQVFAKRAPRQILMTTFNHKGFTFSNWVIRENEELSGLIGAGWRTPQWPLSEKLNFSADILYNRKLFGKFGEKDVVSIGVTFSPELKFKKKK